MNQRKNGGRKRASTAMEFELIEPTEKTCFSIVFRERRKQCVVQALTWRDILTWEGTFYMCIHDSTELLYIETTELESYDVFLSVPIEVLLSSYRVFLKRASKLFPRTHLTGYNVSSSALDRFRASLAVSLVVRVSLSRVSSNSVDHFLYFI